MRRLQWQGRINDADWTLAASARAQPARRLDGLVAFGTQECSSYELTWQLSTDVGWCAQRLDVRLVGLSAGPASTAVPTLNRTLLLERGIDGWHSQSWCRDDADLPAPGLSAADDLDSTPATDADVVIDSCPLSHWAPLRRLGLAGPRAAAGRIGVRPLAVVLPALRVALPSLAVLSTRHRYVGVAESGRLRTLEHSFSGRSATRLTVDEHGIPIEFGAAAMRDIGPDSAVPRVA